MPSLIRKSEERGFADHGWLKARHSFSFASYYDPQFMGYKSLRVINEDRVSEGMGFPTHGHKDMEIITYVIDGALEHKDSMGNGSIIKPGEVQYMSAGTGVQHSEFNPSKDEGLHLMQIWIMPDELNAEPRYDQKKFTKEQKHNQLCLVVSKDGQEDSIAIRQDAKIYASSLTKGNELSHKLEAGRGLWLQMIKGQVSANDQVLSAGDAMAFEAEPEMKISAQSDSEFLLFDLK